MGYLQNLAWAAAVGLATMWLLAGVSTTVYLHRSLAHQALKLHPVLVLPMRFTLWISTGIKWWQWVPVHRLHHIKPDVEGDPHSPALLGQFGGWRNFKLYGEACQDPQIVTPHWHEQRDWWDKRLFDSPYGTKVVLPALQLITLAAVAGLVWYLPLLVAVAWGVHVMAYLASLAVVNSRAHGSSRYAGKTLGNSCNLSLPKCWVTLGEANQLAHHAAPGSARLGKWWKDPGWWFIWPLMRCRWLTINQGALR